METMLLLATLFALYGAYLNSVGIWHGFAIWVVTNFIFCMHNFLIGQWQQSLLFGCYLLISANGLLNARREKNG